MPVQADQVTADTTCIREESIACRWNHQSPFCSARFKPPICHHRPGPVDLRTLNPFDIKVGRTRGLPPSQNAASRGGRRRSSSGSPSRGGRCLHLARAQTAPPVSSRTSDSSGRGLRARYFQNRLIPVSRDAGVVVFGECTRSLHLTKRPRPERVPGPWRIELKLCDQVVRSEQSDISGGDARRADRQGRGPRPRRGQGPAPA